MFLFTYNMQQKAGIKEKFLDLDHDIKELKLEARLASWIVKTFLQQKRLTW